MKTVKVAVIQETPVFLNLRRSVEKARALTEQASAQGAQVVVFPETWLPGYPLWLDVAPKIGLWDYHPAKVLFRTLFENSLTLGDWACKELADTARKTGTFLVMGAHEKQGGTLYNSMLFFGPEKDAFTYHRKLIPTYTERLIWGRGDGSTLNVMETPFGILGGLICWEHWMPLARAAMHAKKEVLHIAQWPNAEDLHHVASRHYAFEGQCFVIAAGCVITKKDVLDGYHSLGPANEAAALLEAMPGEDSTFLRRGGSAVIGPDSHYVLEPVHEDPNTLYATLDFNKISEGHLELDTDGHYSRPDVFHLQVDTRAKQSVTFSKNN